MPARSSIPSLGAIRNRRYRRRTDAERQRLRKDRRDRGELVAPVPLGLDHIDMLEIGWGLDTREAQAVGGNEKLRAQLYREALGEAIRRVLDNLLKKPHA